MIIGQVYLHVHVATTLHCVRWVFPIDHYSLVCRGGPQSTTPPYTYTLILSVWDDLPLPNCKSLFSLIPFPHSIPSWGMTLHPPNISPNCALLRTSSGMGWPSHHTYPPVWGESRFLCWLVTSDCGRSVEFAHCAEHGSTRSLSVTWGGWCVVDFWHLF